MKVVHHNIRPFYPSRHKASRRGRSSCLGSGRCVGIRSHIFHNDTSATLTHPQQQDEHKSVPGNSSLLVGFVGDACSGVCDGEQQPRIGVHPHRHIVSGRNEQRVQTLLRLEPESVQREHLLDQVEQFGVGGGKAGHPAGAAAGRPGGGAPRVGGGLQKAAGRGAGPDDEFKTILAEVRLANPGISMAQAQHLTILRLSERKNNHDKSGSDRGSDDAGGHEREDNGGGDGTKSAANKSRQDRRRRRSLVAMDDKDENKHKLLLQRQRNDSVNTGGGGGANLAPPPMAVGGFLRRNTRNLIPLAKSLPVKDGNNDNDSAAAIDDTVPDRHQPLLKRSSVRDPMLQSIRQLQEELGEVDLSEDDGGGSHDTGAGQHSGSGSGGGTGSRRRGSGSMFRRRGSHASRGSGGRLRRRMSAASSRSDLSIRSERSLEAERIRKGIYTKKSDGNKKKGSGIRSSAKKLLRLGSHGSSKKMRDADSESAGSSQSGDHAQHRPKRRASQAPSLPDIGEDEDYEVPIKSDGDTSNSGKHLRQGGGRRYSDISIEVPVGGDLICRWDNLSRDSIGGDSHVSFDESDGLICGWANASNNGSSRRHTMAGSSSGDDFAAALDDDYDDESENRRGSM